MLCSYNKGYCLSLTISTAPAGAIVPNGKFFHSRLLSISTAPAGAMVPNAMFLHYTLLFIIVQKYGSCRSHSTQCYDLKLKVTISRAPAGAIAPYAMFVH